MTSSPGDRAHARHRPSMSFWLLMLGLVIGIVTLLGLGTWQVQRLQWKRDLIARVTQRVHAPPVAAPDRSRWAGVNAADDEYRHVRVTGTFDHQHAVSVQAVTGLGPGFWLLTPLFDARGDAVLVNRGFVRADAARRKPVSTNATADAGRTAQAEIVTITGLIRMSEPDGAFLRDNDPSAGRWYARDIPAIAAANGLPNVAPYFIDADAEQGKVGDGTADRPVAGLTVVTFTNNHLVYAITWYVLALMLGGFGVKLVLLERHRTSGGTDNNDLQHVVHHDVNAKTLMRH